MSTTADAVEPSDTRGVPDGTLIWLVIVVELATFSGFFAALAAGLLAVLT